MLKIENAEVYGWEAAIRGARNPLNSWGMMDTEYFDEGGVLRVPNVGPKDYKLLHNLTNAGPDHGKFMRMITVSLDITAPLYWWKEFDTYKVGTVANSCSTMHKIHAKEFTLEDFSIEHLIINQPVPGTVLSPAEFMQGMLNALNGCRDMFLRTKEKEWWWQMIQLLPSSYNQRRTVLLNYQVLKSMYHARKNHKLDEWHVFCDWIRGLPYSELITGDSE